MSNIKVEGLDVYYKNGKNSTHAVKNASFNIKKGEILGLIGESGSGKTTIAKAVLSHIPFFANEVNIDGIDIPSEPILKTRKFKKSFATKAQMIFQSPAASLNPYKRTWKVIAEGMYNIKLSKEEKEKRKNEIQKYYNLKVLTFNKKLHSKDLDKLISDFKKSLDSIQTINRKIEAITKEETSFIHHKTILKIDDRNNDEFTIINNDIDEAFNEYNLVKVSQKNSIKRYYKSIFVKVESSNDKNKNPRLNEINKELKKELEAHKVKTLEAKKVYMAKTKKLNNIYKMKLVSYADDRSDQVKVVKKEKPYLTMRQTKKDLLEQRKSIYDETRKLDDDIVALITKVTKKEGKAEEYTKWRDSITSKRDRLIATSKRPFGTNKEIKERAFELLKAVQLPSNVGYSYPSQLSGGQQQRISIARAFSMRPSFIIADEPIASLDVSLQGSIINLIKDMAKKEGVSILFISHDLEMTRKISKRTLVMHNGRILEKGNTDEIFNNPIHPYTRKLISSNWTVDEGLLGVKASRYTAKDHYEGKEISSFKDLGKDHFVYGNEVEIAKWNKRKKGK